jgi:putative intracellular protease/amidase
VKQGASGAVAVLVFDGFADWEPAFALTGLRQWASVRVTTVGYDTQPITSMGGLRVLPDIDLDQLSPENTRLLLLPGGDAWLESDLRPPLLDQLRALETQGVPIAAICGATVALAKGGFFRNRRHTSNGKVFLTQQAPGYESSNLYIETLAVRDRGVISASGLGAVEFAKEIFAELGVFGDTELRLFEEMYRHGRSPPEPTA